MGCGWAIMRVQQVVDERNPLLPGHPGYGVRTGEGVAMLFASLEKHMADHPSRYAGMEWQTYWPPAREAVGYAQQQLADNQHFNTFGQVKGALKRDCRLAETYDHVTGGRASYEQFGSAEAREALPHTDFRYTPTSSSTISA